MEQRFIMSEMDNSLKKMFDDLPTKQQKLWHEGRCFVKVTKYKNPSPYNVGEGKSELTIEWIEIPLQINPKDYSEREEVTNTMRMYIGEYASEYWQDTGELIHSGTKR